MADCNHEYYTIHTTSQSLTESNVEYTCFLTMPLKDVVEAEIITASVETNSNVVHVVVDELETKFSDFATVESNPFNGSTMRNLFGSFYRDQIDPPPADPQYNFPRLTFLNRYIMKHEYIYPIRRLDRLSVTLYDEQGVKLTNPNSPTFITFRFKCLRTNLC